MLNLNEFAKIITIKEGKTKSLSIAQVKEVIKLTFVALATLDEKELEKLLKRYRSEVKTTKAKNVKKK